MLHLYVVPTGRQRQRSDGRLDAPGRRVLGRGRRDALLPRGARSVLKSGASTGLDTPGHGRLDLQQVKRALKRLRELTKFRFYVGH